MKYESDNCLCSRVTVKCTTRIFRWVRGYIRSVGIRQLQTADTGWLPCSNTASMPVEDALVMTVDSSLGEQPYKTAFSDGNSDNNRMQFRVQNTKRMTFPTKEQKEVALWKKNKE